MNATKEQIAEWLEKNSYIVNDDLIPNMIHDCIQDLGARWVSVDKYSDFLSDNDLCWVHFPCGAIKQCLLNKYKDLGGPVDFWQDMNGNDLFMNATKFIKISMPEPPK